MKIAGHEKKVGDCCRGRPQSRNGSSTRQHPDGDRCSDDGKPRDKVSDTVKNMAAGEPAKKFTVGQQVFLDFLR